MRTHSRRRWPRPPSTRTPKPSSATRPGRCCRSTPATSGDAMHIVEETSIAPLRMTGVAGVLKKADQWLGTIVAVAAALLVVAEIVVLFSGVSTRYLFHKPIIWTDELPSILFLWLALLGAVTAFQRGEHMRMTAFMGMVSPQVRAFFDVLAIAAPLAFLALVVHPAYEFAADEALVSRSEERRV